MYVELRNVNKTFGSFKALDEISISIEKGTLVALLGPSGSGKTTILRSIAGLERPDSGEIYIDGKLVNDIPAAKRGVGFVFQNYALFRYMTVFDNIAFGLKIQKHSKEYIEKRVSELISLIGLEGLEKRYPHQLSGGQKQRVAFARALAPNPHLLLLDEPFAAIDAKIRKELRTWLRETISKVGITSIFVTHDQEEAIEVSDKIILTNNGRIEQTGSPLEIYRNPKTPFAAKFVGEGTSISNYDKIRGFQITKGFSSAIIRPEFVGVSKPGKSLYPNTTDRGVVESSFFRGNSQELHIHLYGIKIIADYSLEEEPFQIGEAVDVIINRLFLYNESQVLSVENQNLKNINSVVI
ncbi:sulfate transport system ATP-binding protein [Ruminiclostridium sufflavum DSM 19573]|uniref:ABC-type quaternary amine transporter n=1 Tax=Ruminiclostridium sufflavum DSM 19573 TaxID=1121337 RepID=A0A318XHW7_9FIRM|nr:ABC transporter ATP-binding protein [Ruminiclostridium sufflavum]PYG84855.1 sulfate transport system ATP-binding protein [Ruminiclostridium sufflavum DSM 19573]